MNTANITSWTTNLTAMCRQDPKKAGVLALLVVMLGVLWGRMLMAGPSKASASAKGVAGAVSGPAGPVRATGNNPQRASRPTTSANVRPAQSSVVDERVRAWLTEPIRPINRNLFNVKLEYFPSDGSRPAQGVKTARDGEFWGRLEKSLMLQADQRDKRENLLANYKAEAARLRLDSIMMGPQPKAMIDGKLVAEGDVVAAFRVLKIEARRIMVEREGIRLEIQMK